MLVRGQLQHHQKSKGGCTKPPSMQKQRGGHGGLTTATRGRRAQQLTLHGGRPRHHHHHHQQQRRARAAGPVAPHASRLPLGCRLAVGVGGREEEAANRPYALNTRQWRRPLSQLGAQCSRRSPRSAPRRPPAGGLAVVCGCKVNKQRFTMETRSSFIIFLFFLLSFLSFFLLRLVNVANGGFGRNASMFGKLKGLVQVSVRAPPAAPALHCSLAHAFIIGASIALFVRIPPSSLPYLSLSLSLFSFYFCCLTGV